MKKNITITVIAIIVIVLGYVIIRNATFKLDKVELISFFEDNIRFIVKEEAIVGSSWSMQEILFVGNEGFYVNYSDGASAGAIVMGVSPRLLYGENYSLLGTMVSGSQGLELVDGEDPFADKEREIYNRGEDGEWKKINF